MGITENQQTLKCVSTKIWVSRDRNRLPPTWALKEIFGVVGHTKGRKGERKKSTLPQQVGMLSKYDILVEMSGTIKKRGSKKGGKKQLIILLKIHLNFGMIGGFKR